MQRQNEGHLPPFPIWDDVCTFDGRPWSGIVDVVSGGFPCQDISVAGSGKGLDGARSGLWVEMARIIGEIRPTFCFVENSPMLVDRGLGRVLGDLAAMGYDAEWGVLGAADVGAPHRRDRIWILAVAQHTDPDRLRSYRAEMHQQGISAELPDKQVGVSGSVGANVADSDSLRELQPQRGKRDQRGRISNGGGWEVEPDVGRVADGVAFRVDRLRTIGNGQVPQCAAEAWLRLLARFRF